jgi:ATP-dependent RNA helicase SrmB
LRPQHKEAKLSQRKTKKIVNKKGKTRLFELKEQQISTRKKKKEEKGKQRLRDKKAKGRPQWSVDNRVLPFLLSIFFVLR